MIDWLSGLISTPAREFTGFEAALSLMGALPPDEVIRLLDIRVSSLQAKQQSLDAIIAGMPADFPRMFMIETEFQLSLVTTELEFVRMVLHDLRTDQLSGIKFWRRMHELRATEAGPQEVEAALRAEFPMVFAWKGDAEEQP
jgi:hypothetical protein